VDISNAGLHGRCSVSVLWSSPATASRRRVTCLITLNYPRLRWLRPLVGPDDLVYYATRWLLDGQT